MFFRPSRSTSLDIENNSRRHRPDYVLLLISVALISIGLIVVYAISPGLSAAQHVSENYYVSKQIIAILLGLVAFSVCAFIPTKTLSYVRRGLIVAAAISAIAVQFLGQQINGAYRWIQVGGFSFQSVELIKFALLFYVAEILAARMREGQLNNFQKTIKPLMLLLGVFGAIVAGLQSDLGSAGVIMLMVAVMAFTAGMDLKRIGIIATVVLTAGLIAVSTTGYRRDRLTTFLHPTQDCQGSGYQACQALYAVGSGGMFGLGLGKSVQAYGYLPEAANDSIFAIIAEKFGFIGTSIILGLYFALFSRIKRVIERSSNPTDRLITTGILTWLSAQTIINIGAMIGLLPIKGITLPLISYGGTSIMFVMAAVGVVFQRSKYTSFVTVKESPKRERAGYDHTTVRRGDRRPYYAPLGRR